MKEEANTSNCGKENELIAFLYGELDRREENSFGSHVLECAACRREIEELRGVRESVVLWRNESLGGVSSSTVAGGSLSMDSQRQRSALAALRQFFDLSPLWMKGAVVFASLLFCLFAGLAIARFRETPAAPVATNPNNVQYSEREIKAMVDRQVQEELQRINGSAAQVPTSPQVARDESNRTPDRAHDRKAEVAGAVPFQKARRPLTRTERDQLAADLRLVSAKSDGGLDLLDDRINQ